LSLNWSNKTQYERSGLAQFMKLKEQFNEIKPEEIVSLLKSNYFTLTEIFYETQSSFLTGIYKKYGSLETAIIVECFIKGMNLQILRQKETNLNHDISFKNFWNNLLNISKPEEKISSISVITGIPKETVRRKMKVLTLNGNLTQNKNTKKYFFNIISKNKEDLINFTEEQIILLSKFIFKFAKLLNLNFSSKLVENEIKLQFSFYWYHFLNHELRWLKMWQHNLKDNDLLLIVLQAVIPTIHHANKNYKNYNLDNMFKIIGVVDDKSGFNKTAIGATAVSEVTGIPRATCIRKLEKLVVLGFLIKSDSTKRYFINQNFSDRTKNIITKENVTSTIETFSSFISIILNSLLFNKK